MFSFHIHKTSSLWRYLQMLVLVQKSDIQNSKYAGMENEADI